MLLSIRQTLIGLAVVGCWLLVFLAGLTIDSSPFRESILAGEDLASSLTLTLMSYTVTNAAILCVLAGIAGSLARTAMSKTPSDPAFDREPAVAAPVAGGGHSISAGALRSFAVFLLYMSGVSIGASDAFSNTTQDQYARVVGMTSLLAFVVSFHPELFTKLISGVVPGAARPQPGRN